MSSKHHRPVQEANCPLGRFSASPEAPRVSGIDLVYTVDRSTAGVGETLTFTAWILNSRDERLSDVGLSLRSLTNSQLVPLQYTTQPTSAEITQRVIEPYRCLTASFTYVIDREDVTHAGVLISSLQASLISPSHGILHSECDAIVGMK